MPVLSFLSLPSLSGPVAPSESVLAVSVVLRAVGSTAGAMAGGALGGAAGTFKTAKEANANRFYNRRLDYAQRQAIRREKKDWKSNMTQREGYSY